MGVFYGNFNPDATFTSDIGSITRLATSAPFGRYLQEEIFQQSAFYTSGILAADARLNNTIGTRVELPFFAPLNYIEERVDSSDTWGSIAKLGIIRPKKPRLLLSTAPSPPVVQCSPLMIFTPIKRVKTLWLQFARCSPKIWRAR